MEIVADYLVHSVKMAQRIQEKSGKKLVDFVAALDGDEELKTTAGKVHEWAKQFSIPGV